jgi:hypothetical protein
LSCIFLENCFANSCDNGIKNASRATEKSFAQLYAAREAHGRWASTSGGPACEM